MRADRLQSVRDEFGGPLPDGLRTLSDDELEDLADALVEAQDEQSRAVDGAIDGTLRYLPWPLRVVVRKVLIG